MHKSNSYRQSVPWCCTQPCTEHTKNCGLFKCLAEYVCLTIRLSYVPTRRKFSGWGQAAESYCGILHDPKKEKKPQWNLGVEIL